MTNHPDDAPRLTEKDLDDMEGSGWGMDHMKVHGMAAREIRAARALLADLKADGCPTDERGRCIWCCGEPVEEPGDEPRYHHRPMEDGKPCLWVRIEQS